MLKNISFSASSSFFGSIAEWYRESVICELLTYLEETYFSVSFDSYQNFSVSATTGVTIRNIVLGFAIGIILAAAMVVQTKTGIGGFVRSLITNQCNSPENAKTLSELGYFSNLSVRSALKNGVSLRKLVRCQEEEAVGKSESFTNETQENEPVEAAAVEEFVIDPSTMHFYIPEELHYRAELRYDQKGSSWRFFPCDRVDIPIEEAHQPIDLLLRTAPVLGREGVDGHGADVKLTAAAKDAAAGLRPRGVTLIARKTAALCPTAVAIHNEGNMRKAAVK